MSEGETRADIAAAVAAMAEKTFLKRSIATVHEHLGEGETVVALASAMRTAEMNTGLLVLTGRRLFFYRRSRSGIEHFDIPWERGSSVSWTSGWLTGNLTVATAGIRWEFTSLHKDDGERFAGLLREHRFSEPLAAPPAWYSATAAPGPVTPAPVGPAPASPSASTDAIISQLERLGALYERGILDEDEFARAKSDLLARMTSPEG